MSCTLTWLHPVGGNILWSVCQIRVGPQRSVERLDLMQREVQHCISGGVVEVYPIDLAAGIKPARSAGGQSSVSN